MFVVKAIVIQFNGQVYGSINERPPTNVCDESSWRELADEPLHVRPRLLLHVVHACRDLVVHALHVQVLEPVPLAPARLLA